MKPASLSYNPLFLTIFFSIFTSITHSIRRAAAVKAAKAAAAAAGTEAARVMAARRRRSIADYSTVDKEFSNKADEILALAAPETQKQGCK